MNPTCIFLIGLTLVLFVTIIIIVIVKLQTCPKDYICMHRKSFKDIHGHVHGHVHGYVHGYVHGHGGQHGHVHGHSHGHSHGSHVHGHVHGSHGGVHGGQHRDIKVLSDPLYPPLNRTDRTTFDHVVRETDARNINVPTTNINDTYRLVGYLINNGEKDAGGNKWKVMARQKNRHESDFYLIPTNKDYDVKVPLTHEIVLGQRLKDVYTIPKELRFNSPLLNTSTYEFVELPKSSFADNYN